jgi:uncharacterized protein
MNRIAHTAYDMLAKMSPVLQDGAFVFCSTPNADQAAAGAKRAIATFVEREGYSLILAASDAESLGFDCSNRMRQITLQVYSALDGVGLTAAVASALAELNISCNVVAAYHHDHIFVPESLAERALKALQDLQRKVMRS